MEDDLNFKENGRRPQFKKMEYNLNFQTMEDDLNFKKMEDELIFYSNGWLPYFQDIRRQPQF